MSRVPWSFRTALVTVGAALVTLAALPVAANALAAKPASAAAPAVQVASPSTVAGEAAAAKVSLAVYQTYGTQQGAVRGPGGQIWLISMMPPEFQGRPAGSQALDEVSPTTGAVNYWAPLPPWVGRDTTLLAYDHGAPAFDGTGKAWMIASATAFSGAQSYYLVRYTPGPSTSAIYKVPAACSAPHDITAAGDGSVWLSCNSARAIRVAESGAMKMFRLSRVTTLGSLAAGPSGSIWAVGYNAAHASVGLVRITAAGGESYYPTPRGITARGVAGDGSGRVVETATCSGSAICFELISTKGTLAHVGTVPDRVSGISGPAMDAKGNVWVLVHGTWSKTGQYFLRLTSGNKLQAYAFSLPACGGTLLSIAGIPAGSADGSVWAESVTSCTSIGNAKTAYVGAAFRLKP